MWILSRRRLIRLYRWYIYFSIAEELMIFISFNKPTLFESSIRRKGFSSNIPSFITFLSVRRRLLGQFEWTMSKKVYQTRVSIGLEPYRKSNWTQGWNGRSRWTQEYADIFYFACSGWTRGSKQDDSEFIFKPLNHIVEDCLLVSPDVNGFMYSA